MNLKVCDVCLNERSRFKEAEFQTTKRQGAIRASAQVCREHRDFFEHYTLQRMADYVLNSHANAKIMIH
jgi:hypothetical protein